MTDFDSKGDLRSRLKAGDPAAIDEFKQEWTRVWGGMVDVPKPRARFTHVMREWLSDGRNMIALAGC